MAAPCQGGLVDTVPSHEIMKVPQIRSSISESPNRVQNDSFSHQPGRQRSGYPPGSDGETGLCGCWQVVADKVRGDPKQYDAAFLGKSNEEYSQWILNPEKWGGWSSLPWKRLFSFRRSAIFGLRTHPFITVDNKSVCAAQDHLKSTPFSSPTPHE